MKNKLTKKNKNKTLTSFNNAKFAFVLSNRFLEKKFQFSDKTRDYHETFINKMLMLIDLPWSEIKKSYYCKKDKNDNKDGKRIQHIKLTGSMRVHGYESNGVFVITRFDPNHNFHD